ncbi:hypothetical protein SCHPADRAFT_39840 [Schizopora paradoxa]|uniref:Uncharacterized protein n=1 Tax=Schizopora paradoxa TaxID=27342 RepID=A0A0H2S712_9AGAM|nr:hypothetical protein SCHPADRAFT_39840 [Schizopora paradoxa]
MRRIFHFLSGTRGSVVLVSGARNRAHGLCIRGWRSACFGFYFFFQYWCGLTNLSRSPKAKRSNYLRRLTISFEL